MSSGFVKQIEAQAAAGIKDLPPISFISAKDFTPEMHAERAQEMERLYRDQDYPRSMAEIGLIYGMTRERVRQIFKEHGIPTRSKKESFALSRARHARYGSDIEPNK